MRWVHRCLWANMYPQNGMASSPSVPGWAHKTQCVHGACWRHLAGSSICMRWLWCTTGPTKCSGSVTFCGPKHSQNGPIVLCVWMGPQDAVRP
ncbi:hypothetical protein DUNSADRAFT_14496 [Dunaliella salina]|uniref:Encoded protein n=1 Tax=Dunaliella salina TaxID=3046 RepID=A0ABQ7H2L0_DUNSA|nr:hypothetical protein DUNSADRAFT_14496 [Dunaliella salina]|eukprot:KAF5841097.1 hypothetical protein DUNSADRAFT_14496 [Dunaliella salina]